MQVPPSLFDLDELKRGSGTGGHSKFAILRVAKLKSVGNLKGSLQHTFRERETWNADAERTRDNTVLHGAPNAEGVEKAWRERAPEVIRKNGVRALEYLITGSPKAIAGMSRDQQDRYFQKSLEWLQQKHGKENVLSAVVHRDETTPHMSALVIPIDHRGRLNAAAFTDGRSKLSQMQTDFHSSVAQDLGLERGIEGSKAKHRSISAYYAAVEKEPTASISLPERHTGRVLGIGGESDQEYRERLSRLVSERLKEFQAHYGERAFSAERQIQTLVNVVERRDDVLKRKLGLHSEEERDGAFVELESFLAIQNTRNLNEWECRRLIELAEISLGKEGFEDLLSGDISNLPGEARTDQLQLGADIARAGIKVDPEGWTRASEAMVSIFSEMMEQQEKAEAEIKRVQELEQEERLEKLQREYDLREKDEGLEL